MINVNEITEYKNLHASLVSLHEGFLKKRQEVKFLLEETVIMKKNAFQVILKASRLTHHLTVYQRQVAGFSYHVGELKAKINRNIPVVVKNGAEEAENLPEIRENFKSRIELKQTGIALISMIDRVKKKLLQLNLLELRCKELICSIKKALEAFRYEYNEIRRKLYPYSFFSLIRRYLRKLRGETYFSHKDMPNLCALGNITGLVLKIADSPLA